MSEERALVSGLPRQDDTTNAIMEKAAAKAPAADTSADQPDQRRFNVGSVIKFPGVDSGVSSLRDPLTPVSREPAPVDTGIGSVSSRNLANNNPGNMKAEDGSYLKFPTREAGEAAIGSWFDRAQSVHGLKTIEDLIDDPAHRGAHGYSSKYDPGNAGKDLAAKLAAHVGVSPNEPVDVTNPLIKQKLVEGILIQEGRAPGGVDGTQYAQQQSAAYASLTNNAKQSQKLVDELLKEDPRKPETMRRLAEAQDMQRQYMQQALKLQEKMPSADPREPMQKLGGLATIVGILGGLLTKTPMTASLNAGAAAMEAYKAQDDTAYKRNMEQWGYHTDMLLKMAKFEQDTYKEILNDEKITAAEKSNKLNTVAHLLGSQRMIDASMLGDLRAAQNHQDTMQNHRETLAEQKREHDLRYAQAGEKEQPWRQYATSLDKQWEAEHPGAKIPETVKQENIKAGLKEAPASLRAGQGLLGNTEIDRQAGNILQKRASDRGVPYDQVLADPEERRTAILEAATQIGESRSPGVKAREEKEVDTIVTTLDQADELKGLIERGLTVGIGGKIVRPIESLENMLNLTDDTTRRQVESQIALLKMTAGRLLTNRSIVTGREHEEMDKIVRGMRPGDTVQNTIASISTLQRFIRDKNRTLLKKHGYGDDVTGGDQPPASQTPTPAPTVPLWQSAPVVQ